MRNDLTVIEMHQFLLLNKMLLFDQVSSTISINQSVFARALDVMYDVSYMHAIYGGMPISNEQCC